MAEAERQVATLAELVSQHAVVTHRTVFVLQQEEQERRQQQLQLFVRIRMVGKVKTNAKYLTITTNALPSIRMACDCLRKCCESKYAFLANFSSMFLKRKRKNCVYCNPTDPL